MKEFMSNGRTLHLRNAERECSLPEKAESCAGGFRTRLHTTTCQRKEATLAWLAPSPMLQSTRRLQMMAGCC